MGRNNTDIKISTTKKLKMASETSDWIVLGETIKFTANLQKSPNPEFLPLFPDKSSDQEEFLMTLEAQIDNTQIPWLQTIKNENVEFWSFWTNLDLWVDVRGRKYKMLQLKWTNWSSKMKRSTFLLSCMTPKPNFPTPYPSKAPEHLE